MAGVYNIYCDESSHLEHDGHHLMVMGAVWCPAEKAREIAVRLREIKVAHGLPSGFEVKWSKVSPGLASFYTDVLDYFFDDDDLHVRILAANKETLRHEAFSQSHDTWYYKMYFQLLHVLLNPEAEYRVYLDIKDTRSAEKLATLHRVLCNRIQDYERQVITRVQTVRSHEVEQIQLADLLIGAVGYANRGLTTNAAKLALVERMRKRSRYSLMHSTLLREEKVNLFHWEGQVAG